MKACSFLLNRTWGFCHSVFSTLEKHFDLIIHEWRLPPFIAQGMTRQPKLSVIDGPALRVRLT